MKRLKHYFPTHLVITIPIYNLQKRKHIDFLHVLCRQKLNPHHEKYKYVGDIFFLVCRNRVKQVKSWKFTYVSNGKQFHLSIVNILVQEKFFWNVIASVLMAIRSLVCLTFFRLFTKKNIDIFNL